MERIHNFRQLDNNIVGVLRLYWDQKNSSKQLTEKQMVAWDHTIITLFSIIMCDLEWAHLLFARAGIPIHERKGEWLEAGPRAREAFEERKQRQDERRERRERRG